MDPTANLEMQRGLVEQIIKLASADLSREGVELLSEMAIELAELQQALDAWLCNGNFLPKPWAL